MRLITICVYVCALSAGHASLTVQGRDYLSEVLGSRKLGPSEVRNILEFLTDAELQSLAGSRNGEIQLTVPVCGVVIMMMIGCVLVMMMTMMAVCA